MNVVQLAERARSVQPDRLKPELGEDVMDAAEDWHQAARNLAACEEQLAAAVCDAHRAGLPVQDCARLAGVTRRTAYKWIAKEDN